MTKRFTRSYEEHIFTFGSYQHSIPGAFVLIKGCDAETARTIMNAVHLPGPGWSMHYEGSDVDRIAHDKRYSLVQVIEVGGEWRED
jgi:hypothetical protein